MNTREGPFAFPDSVTVRGIEFQATEPPFWFRQSRGWRKYASGSWSLTCDYETWKREPSDFVTWSCRSSNMLGLGGDEKPTADEAVDSAEQVAFADVQCIESRIKGLEQDLAQARAKYASIESLRKVDHGQ